MSFNISAFLNEDNAKALGSYLKIIERADQSIVLPFFLTVTELRKYGIEYNVRHIDWLGRGGTISTCGKWKMVEYNNNTITEEKEHFTPELQNANARNLKIITRSSDKVKNNFLSRMEYHGLNNSIIYLDFDTEDTTMKYLMCDPSRPELRDFILTHHDFFKQLIDNTNPLINFLVNSDLFSRSKRQVIERNLLSRNSLIGDMEAKKFNREELIVGGFKTQLTNCESAYMNYLGLGIDVHNIAKMMNKQNSTVRTHINNLKDKLQVNSMQELRTISRQILENKGADNVK